MLCGSFSVVFRRPSTVDIYWRRATNKVRYRSVDDWVLQDKRGATR